MADELTNSIIARSMLNDQARRQADSERVDKALWQLIAVSDRLEGRRDAAHARDMELQKSKGKSSAQLGLDEPLSSNPMLQNAGHTGYLEGGAKRNADEQERLLKQVLEGMEQSGAYQRTSLQQEQANARNDATIEQRDRVEGGRNERFAAQYGQRGEQHDDMMRYRWASLSSADRERASKSKYFDSMIKLQTNVERAIGDRASKIAQRRANPLYNILYKNDPSVQQAEALELESISQLEKLRTANIDDPVIRAQVEMHEKRLEKAQGVIDSKLGTPGGMPPTKQNATPIVPTESITGAVPDPTDPYSHPALNEFDDE